MFKNITIKTSISLVVGILLALLAYQSVTSLLHENQWKWEAERMTLANDLTDHVLDAASIHAIERGISASALSSTTKTPQATIDKIKDDQGKR